MDHDDLLEDFVVESREHLADIESELLALESQADDLDLELVNKVFRALHSIKGASGFLGLETLCELSHRMENVLDAIRNQELAASSRVVDALLEASDKLKSMFDDLGSSDEADIGALLQVLDAIQLGEPEQAASPVRGVPSEAAPGADALAIKAPSGATLRVSIDVLDRLMNLAGELVLGRNQLLQRLEGGEFPDLELVGARLDRVTGELQEAIMQTRMQPIGKLFARFPRVVRDLSAALGKEVCLVCEGDEVELDRTLIEALSDPLTHLVRNAIDHGIEAPELRRGSGKPSTGTLALRASHDGGTVRLSVSDDGAGIDVERLAQRAVSKGLVTPERARELGEREALRLICLPGFSTREEVTDISGRGVGMDVVRTNLEKLGGTLELDSRPGSGTTLSIKLPLTLAIIPALVVGAGDETYALPQHDIVELVRVKAEDARQRIERLHGAEVLRLRGRLLPLVRLEELLGGEPAEATTSAGAIHVIVVSAGKLRYGLVVAQLHDTEEIVVKPLGREVQRAACFSAATILGDGRVALILDIAGMAALAGLELREGVSGSEGARDDSLPAREATRSVVVFRNHPDEAFALDARRVVRIERIEPSQRVSVGGAEALRGEHGLLPLLRLEDVLHARPAQAPEGATCFTLVVEVAGRELGLVAPWLEDIREIPECIDRETLRAPGVAGSATLEAVVTRLLDVDELVLLAHPQWRDAPLELERSAGVPHEHHEHHEAGRETLQLASFYVGEQRFALELVEIQEILRLRDLTRIPHSAPEVRGVIHLRGEALSVLDLGTLVGLGETALEACTRLLILRGAGQPVGLLVERLSEVLELDPRDLEPPPANLAELDTRLVRGVQALSSELLIVLCASQLLASRDTPTPEPSS